MTEEKNFIPYEPSSQPPGPWLIFAPHPDDDVFGMGGTMALAANAGIRIEVVVVTGGEAAGNPDERREESLRAGEILGVSKYHFWSVPDRDIANARIPADRIKSIIDHLEPQTVFLPGIKEYNPDHRSTTKAIRLFLKNFAYAGNVWLYEISRQNEANRLIDITSVLGKKVQAIKCFTSQLTLNDYESAVLAINSSRAYTLPPKTTHAEAFWAGRPSIGQDPCLDQYRAGFNYKINQAPEGSPLVSVIVRTRNRLNSLVEAVKSISSQTYPKLEIVLVNDGGFDVSAEVQEAALDIPIVFIRHDKCLGRGAAANSGLRAAKGKYITFLDDDDILYADHIENLVDFAEKISTEVVYSSVLNVYFQGSPENPADRVKDELIFNKPFDPDLILFENYVPIMSVLFHSKVVEKTGLFDEKLELFEDWEFWIRVSREFDFYHLDKITAEYRFYHSREMEESHQDKYQYDQARIELFDKVIPYLNGKAWVTFIKKGMVSRLKKDVSIIHKRAIELESDVARLIEAHDKCSAWGHGLQKEFDGLIIAHNSLNAKYWELKNSHDNCLDRNSELTTTIEDIRNSTSWRVTAPFRLISRVFRTGPLGLIKKVYHRLPFSYTARSDLKSFFYKRFPLFFRRTDSYKIWLETYKAPLIPDCAKYSAQDFLPGPDEKIVFEKCSEPLVTAAVNMGSSLESILMCLNSLKKQNSGLDYEVIVYADKPDPQMIDELKKRVHGLIFLGADMDDPRQSPRNLYDRIKGKYLFFLSSELVVLPGIVQEMVRCISENYGCGLAGAKVISSSGKIFEAGCLIDAKGSIVRPGKGLDSFHPDVSFTREVDFFSQNCVMISGKAWDEIKGDLSVPQSSHIGFNAAQALREKGYRIIYHPLAQSVMTGEAYAQEYSSGHGRSLRSSVAASLGKILVIDIWTPTPDQDSGSVDIVSYFKIFRSLGYDLTFVPAADLNFVEKYTSDLQRIGVKCLYRPFIRDIPFYLKEHGTEFDMVIIYRVHCAAGNMEMVRKYCPGAKIVFDTVDLHFLREERQAQKDGSRELFEQSRDTKRLELSMINKSDAVILLSPFEKMLLENDYSVDPDKLYTVPLVREIPGRSKGFRERSGILFIGGFQHRPNVDAVIFFLSEIWPMVRQLIPGITFTIIGSKVPEDIKKLCGPDVRLLGYVKDIEPIFSTSRLSVAPLRYGAGLKGKVATSLSYGVPCVATSMAVEGSEMKNRKEIFIEDEPDAFAKAIFELYENEDIWNSISDEGLNYVNRHYSIEAGRKKLKELLMNLGLRAGEK